MKQEERMELYGYLRNYIIQKDEHDDYVDYYKIFGFNRNMTIDELKQGIKDKKIIKLFHPDQESGLEAFFQPFFRESCDDIKDMIQIFSDEIKKQQYDGMLKEKENTTKVDLVEIDEKEALDKAIIDTINKYGFHNGYVALQKALRGDFHNITRDNGDRNIVSAIGKERLRNIVANERKDIMETNGDNIVAEYLNKVINSSELKTKADSFYNMCLQTAIEKVNNPSSCDVAQAIDIYTKENYPSGFSNRNNERDQFMENNINAMDIWLLVNLKVHDALGSKKTDYLFSNMTKVSKDAQYEAFGQIMDTDARKMQQQSNK